MFKFIFFSYELGQTKRTPSTFQKILQQIGRQPAACLFIDDSLTNIQAAETIGLAGIQFKSAAQLRQALVEKGIGHI
jgi:HAD superfamily hydrolase (TIGR01509 family)